MDRLAVLDEKGARWSIAISDRFCIGRDGSNDLQIEDRKVSRQHCVIVKKDGDVIIQDLGSSNGTFVNGQRVTEAPLFDGDKIQLGAMELIFECGEETAQDKTPDFNGSIGGVYRVNGVGSFFREGVHPDSLRATFNRLTTLFEIGNIVNTYRDPDALIQAILRQIVRIIDADRYYLLLKNRESDTLDVAAVHPEQAGENGRMPEISRTILDAVLREGTSILSVDTPHDMRFSGARSVIMYEINSVMCAPLRSHEHIMGVIQVHSRDPSRFFTKEDLNLLTAVGISAGIAIENMNLYEDLKRLFRSTVKSLVTALEANDPYTGGHSVRVAEYSKRLAVCLGLSTHEVEEIELAAFLHDIGKIGIPHEVLNKPSSFSTQEFNFMQKHPEIGYEILSNIEGMEKIAKIVRHHHERYDGKGYPDGLAGDGIPLGSRILGIVDTFDAITTDRPYRKGATPEVAFEEVSRNAGSQFDPKLIREFFACLNANMKELFNESQTS